MSSIKTLDRLGLYFDELNKLRLWNPEAADETRKLQDLSADFIDKVRDFEKTVDKAIQILEKLCKRVEYEKLRALGANNRLISMEKERAAQQQQLQAQIFEKSVELERLRFEIESLQKIETEQDNFLDQF